MIGEFHSFITLSKIHIIFIKDNNPLQTKQI